MPVTPFDNDEFVSHIGVQRDHPVDYFTLLTNIRPIPQRWPNTAIEALDLLRKTKAMRPYVFTVPQAITDVIPPTARLETQIQVDPGSWLWNVQVVYPSSGLVDDTNLSILITDTASGVPLSKYYVAARAYGRTAGEPSTAGSNQYYSAIPKPVTGQGQLNIELCNYSYNNFTGFQILLFFCCPIPDVRMQLSGSINSGGAR